VTGYEQRISIHNQASYLTFIADFSARSGHITFEVSVHLLTFRGAHPPGAECATRIQLRNTTSAKLSSFSLTTRQFGMCRSRVR